ncbi:MAG: hypothetical protein HKN92_08460, partial [Chitinophagales bacterium]|nr:hypothetical protein [Chitinophagales bacterium]
MAKVNLDLFSMSITQKLDTASKVVNSLRNNPYFYHYPFPLNKLLNVVNRLKSALRVGKLDKNNCDILSLIELEESLESLIFQIANKVERISRGNAVLIASAGFDVYRHPMF